MEKISKHFLLDREVCVITGAGKGIGREIAKVFAAMGCRLALISRTEKDLIALEEELQIPKSDLFWMSGDASDPDTVARFVNETHSIFGSINILVNNAGMRFRKSFTEIRYAEWQEVMNINLGSTFLFSQEVGKHMINQNRGKIINMASIVGTLGLPDLCAYAASKGGIISLTKSLSLEWAKHNINVNVLAPGFCETSYAENFKKNDELYNFTIERTPMRRWGKPVDIANACVFLSSEASRYITGEVINVDGGWSAW